MTVSIENYMSRSRVFGLCAELGIGDEVTGRIEPYLDGFDYSAIAPDFDKLFAHETAAEGSKAIEAFCADENGKTQDDGFMMMAVLLAAACRTREIYAGMGITDKIFLDTMGFFKRLPEENKRFYGKVSFDREYWFYRDIAMLSLRVGELSFEMRYKDFDVDEDITPEVNVPILSVHIPSDAVMTRDKLDESYASARELFAKHFPSFKYKYVYCSTWLLSPELRRVLPLGSRILEFQSGYRLIKTYDDNASVLYWVFNIRNRDADVDYNTLPENTSLRRGIKRGLLAGERFGSAAGIYTGGGS